LKCPLRGSECCGSKSNYALPQGTRTTYWGSSIRHQTPYIYVVEHCDVSDELRLILLISHKQPCYRHIPILYILSTIHHIQHNEGSCLKCCWCLVHQEIVHFYWSWRDYYCIQWSWPLDPIYGQFNSVP
jgi:hypothetical protein